MRRPKLRPRTFSFFSGGGEAKQFDLPAQAQSCPPKLRPDQPLTVVCKSEASTESPTVLTYPRAGAAGRKHTPVAAQRGQVTSATATTGAFQKRCMGGQGFDAMPIQMVGLAAEY